MAKRAIVWFRLDLRMADNPALYAAVSKGYRVLPLFVWDKGDPWDYGGASKWWLDKSLRALQRDIPMVLKCGKPAAILRQMVAECRIDAVFWNRNYEPYSMARDAEIKTQLSDDGITVESFRGRLMHEPWEVKNKEGGPYKVFTPFWKAALDLDKPAPLPAPEQVDWLEATGDDLDDWKLLPTQPNWAGGLEQTWTPGEDGAWSRFETFIQNGLKDYGEERNRPDKPACVSMLSPHLHWGEISPVQIWARIQEEFGGVPSKSAQKFLSEVGWREFAFNILQLHPKLPEENWKKEFDRYPWVKDDGALLKWQKGETGYPIVDAGMRQLYATGYMHNRVRMIVASFLIKHLRIHWRKGADWFWDTLVDADSANNSASWQWVAGSGADAAPYFRIFNPIGQGEKFDPDGVYVKQWVPELKDMPREFIHQPWEAPALVLKAAGVTLGETYPEPMVEHKAAREAALAGYEQVKGRPA